MMFQQQFGLQTSELLHDVKTKSIERTLLPLIKQVKYIKILNKYSLKRLLRHIFIISSKFSLDCIFASLFFVVSKQIKKITSKVAIPIPYFLSHILPGNFRKTAKLHQN